MLKTELTESASERIKDYKELQESGFINLDNQFYPSVHYPPITMYPPTDEEALFKGYQNPPDNLFVVYAHIPFCMKYCTFCHYPNRIGEQHEEKERYLNTIEKEMDIYMNRLGIDKIKARSILVGGGTPTYLTPAQLNRFLKSFTSRLDLSSSTQFNYDVDPITLLGEEGKERLKIMKSYGVDRLTIGVQSLSDEMLKKMNRHHNSEEAVKSINQAKEYGYQLNIEFIYGYPGDTLKSWIETIEKAVKLDVEEIQIYRLKIIPYGDHKGFILRRFQEKRNHFLEAELVIMMKAAAISILAENGYNENLRRVYTKKPEFFSHYASNQCCDLFDQIGFGLTAFSSLRDRFALNTQNFDEYYSMVEGGKIPINRGLVRNKDDQIRWGIVLPLKNRDILKNYYKKRTGVSLNEVFRKKIERLKSFDLLDENEKVLKLTLKGAFFADEVCHQFHHPDYIPFHKETYSAGILNPYNDWQPFEGQ